MMAVAPTKKTTTVGANPAANNICDTCKAIGLPILLVRYAAVLWYSDSKGIADWAKHPNYERSPSQIEYLLRILRMGYVYLYYPIQNGQPKKWECYMVTVSGHLVKQSSPDIISPPAAGVACKKTAHDSTKLEYITIQNPEKYSEVYIAFSENNWTQAVRSNYEKNAKLRQKRMSLINPKSMSTNKNVKIQYGTSASVSRINDIVEYGGYTMGSGSIFSTMPDEAGMVPKKISSDAGTIGDYKFFKKTVTNTLWQKRLNKAESTYKSMQAKLKNAQGDAYVLAIPDEVGAVKELSDMSRQPTVWQQKYHQELEVKIAAMQMITGIETSMTGRTDEYREVYYSAWQRYKKAFDYAKYLNFKNNYHHLEREVYQFTEPRAASLIERLKGEAFINTLSDFNQDHAYDGARFEYLMNYIFEGLGQTEAGAAQIEVWVDDLSPANIETNLVWRTFAFNQKKAFVELYTLLKRIKVARAAKSVITPLLKIKTIEKEKKVVDYLAATQNYFDSSKSLTDIYKGVTDARVNLFINKIKASDYSDHFLAAITRPLVSSFTSTAVNLGMTDTLLAGRVLMRSGASPFAINELMSKVRANLPLLRPVSLSPIGFNRLQRPSTTIFAQIQARATLTEAYKNFKISSIKGSSAGLGTFLGGGIVFMEVINFYKLSVDAASKKDAKSYSQLFASGLAVVGGLAATYAFRVDALNQNTNVNYGKLKAFAGVTLGIAGYIGAFWDFEERQARKRKGYNGVALAYTIKVVMGTANATGVAITGFQTGEGILKSMASGAVGQGALRVGAVAIGRIFLTAATWQFSAALFALQLLIWKIDKDELERWLAKTPFEDNEFNDVKTMQNKLLEVINGLNEG